MNFAARKSRLVSQEIPQITEKIFENFAFFVAIASYWSDKIKIYLQIWMWTILYFMKFVLSVFRFVVDAFFIYQKFNSANIIYHHQFVIDTTQRYTTRAFEN